MLARINTENCEVGLWTKLSQVEKFKLKIKADLDPVFFWEHPAMGGVTLWPSQKQLLKQFYEKDKNGKRKYKELLFAAGMRSGKTTIAALIVLTELYKCLFMDSPQKHYDLLPKEDILFLATASTEKQCHRTVFKKILAFVESSPFFCSFADEIKFTQGRLEFPGNLVILGLGSNLKANVGLTVKVFVAEEINFTGEETYKVSPKALYNKLAKSTTTFKPFGEDIKVAISSQADGSDFLSQRIKLTREQELDTTLILEKTTLELNPNITREMVNDEFLMDEDSANLDYGLGAGRDGSYYFKKNMLNKIETEFKKYKNIFIGEPEYGRKEQFNPDLDLENLKYDPEADEYGIFTDPASLTDGFGLTLAHITINGKIICDGVTIFMSNKGEEIDPTLVRDIIRRISNIVPVEFHQFDIYMYNELRNELSDKGIGSFQHHLRLPDWEALKDRISIGSIEVPYSDYLFREISGLRNFNGKVNHSIGGSKDMLDPICQAVAHWDNPTDNVKLKTERKENSPIVIEGMSR